MINNNNSNKIQENEEEFKISLNKIEKFKNTENEYYETTNNNNNKVNSNIN